MTASGAPRPWPADAEARRADIEAVTEVALGRHRWVQTPMARTIVSEAAAHALKPCLERMAAQAVGSGSKAAVVLAKRACETPPSRLPGCPAPSR